MGKKGDALRAAKLNTVTYTFTKAQLEEHDRMVKEAIKELEYGQRRKTSESDTDNR